jgi:lipopolysaccharide biosynthesis glycosyltransferase
MIAPDFPDAVFFAADKNYLPNAWVAAKAAAAEPGRRFDVLLLVETGVLPEGLAAPPGCRLLEIELPEAARGWPSPAHMSPFAYARLAAPDLWLNGYRRALYLDSDITIAGPLAPLLSLDLGDATLAMAEDCGRYLRDDAAQRDWRDYRQALAQDPDEVYFNSGVVLIDLQRWRDQRCWERAYAFIERHARQLRFMDQDALNFVCAGRIKEISPRWNFQTHYLGLGLEREIAPRIIHYVDILKPWRDPEWRVHYDTAHAAVWAKLFANSPWPSYVHPDLYRAPSLFWPAWRLRRAAAAAAKRHLPAAAIAFHLKRLRTLAPQLMARVRVGMADRVARGCYADLTADDALRWGRTFAQGSEGLPFAEKTKQKDLAGLVPLKV